MAKYIFDILFNLIHTFIHALSVERLGYVIMLIAQLLTQIKQAAVTL